MHYKLHFSASDALYEEGGALFESSQPQFLTLGPFPEYIELTYELLRVGPEGEQVAALVDGVWRVGVQRIPAGNGWTSVSPAPNGPIFSDVVIEAQS